MFRFSDKEAEYLAAHRLGRIATASVQGQPHVVPVGYEFDGSYIYFSGYNLKLTLKFRNIQHNRKVAFVVDEVRSTNPWSPSGIEIRGTAEPIWRDGYLYIKITPATKASWGQLGEETEQIAGEVS